MKKIKKVLVFMLMLSVLLSSSGLTALATEETNEMKETGVSTKEESEQTDNGETLTVSSEEVELMEKQQAFEYVYIDEQIVNIPQEQNVVVAFADNELVLEKATLYYESVESGQIYELQAANIVDNTVLFTKQYSDESEAGTYQLNYIAYTIVGQTEEVSVEFAEQDVNAEYVVTIDPEEELAGSGEQEKTDEITVYALDDEDHIIEEDSENIEDAIETAIVLANEESVAETKAEVSAFSMARTEEEKDEFIIVICPGHDATHAGAAANGLKEQELTFKVAQYCKAELEKYSGVKVYLSRDTIGCSYPGKDKSYCLQQRVIDADALGADVFVDMHFNTGGGRGAEIYYPNNSYSTAIYMEGKELAEQMLNQLEALGLYNRGAKTKNCTDGIKDDDGNLADYYTSIALSKSYGMVGIIVEHAFLDNTTDAEKLKNESFLKQLGIADAKGIANAYGLTVGTGSGNESNITLPFKDVSENAWYYDVVKYVYSKGIMTGLNGTTFGPDSVLSRAQFATVLYRIEGEPSVTYRNKYPDVAKGIWYTSAVLWANEANVITGYENGLFGIADNITREQIVLILYRYAGYKGYNNSQRNDLSTFSDAKKVSGFAYEAMQWAVAQGIISGKNEGKIIDPQGNASRAECGAMIMRFESKYGK